MLGPQKSNTSLARTFAVFGPEELEEHARQWTLFSLKLVVSHLAKLHGNILLLCGTEKWLGIELATLACSLEGVEFDTSAGCPLLSDKNLLKNAVISEAAGLVVITGTTVADHATLERLQKALGSEKQVCVLAPASERIFIL